MMYLKHLFLQKATPLLRLPNRTGSTKSPLAPIGNSAYIMTSFAHKQLKSCPWVTTISKLFNLFYDNRSNVLLVFSYESSPILMFIEKDSPQNVSLHDFTITEKTEKGEAFGSSKFINSYTLRKPLSKPSRGGTSAF